MSVISHPLIVRVLVVIGLTVSWQLIAEGLQPALLPSPIEVLQKLAVALESGALAQDLTITLVRVAISFSVAILVGFGLGCLMGMNRCSDALLDVPIQLLLNIPALVVVILCFLWFGLSNSVAILAVVLNKTPMVTVVIREGVKALDPQLFEVAKVFRFSPVKTFWHVFMPQMLPHVLSAVRNGLALIWKIVLVVELIGCSEGIGFRLGVFFQYFDIANILAYTLAFVSIILLVEFLVVQPIERRSTVWRHVTG